MKSLCIFIHYKFSETIPLYVQLYVNELSAHFDELVIVHNEPHYAAVEMSFNENISFAVYPNEGYDLGLFYKFFSQIDQNQYHQIACINDSNVLFNELLPIFNWGKEQEVDFWGLLDSNEKPWFSKHKNNYHIQSHFLVFNRNAILLLNSFFSSIDITLIFNEKNVKKLRRLVIGNWEIGLSRYLFDCGLKGKSYISCTIFQDQHKLKKPANLGHTYYAELIESGIPIIKKKVILNRSDGNSFRVNANWENLLQKHGNRKWNIDALICEMRQLKENSASKFLKVINRTKQSKD
jgi:lipopolysaccharide biosynthesis protein